MTHHCPECHTVTVPGIFLDTSYCDAASCSKYGCVFLDDGTEVGKVVDLKYALEFGRVKRLEQPARRWNESNL